MKIETYAATVKVADVIWIAPTGKKTAVKITVTEIELFSNWITIKGERQTAKGIVQVSASLPGFAPIKMEM